MVSVAQMVRPPGFQWLVDIRGIDSTNTHGMESTKVRVWFDHSPTLPEIQEHLSTQHSEIFALDYSVSRFS